MEWDPATGAELPPEFVEVGPAGTVESWTWVPVAVRAASARPSVRLRAHPPRRGHHPPAARGRRRNAGSHGRRDAGGSPLAGNPGGSHRRHHLLRARRAPETEGTDTGAAPEPVTRMDYLASITYRNPVPDGRRPGHRRVPAPPAARPGLSHLRAGLRRRPGLLPYRRPRARPRVRGRSAP